MQSMIECDHYAETAPLSTLERKRTDVSASRAMAMVDVSLKTISYVSIVLLSSWILARGVWWRRDAVALMNTASHALIVSASHLADRNLTLFLLTNRPSNYCQCDNDELYSILNVTFVKYQCNCCDGVNEIWTFIIIIMTMRAKESAYRQVQVVEKCPILQYEIHTVYLFAVG